MSLTKPSLIDVVKKQYLYKLNMHRSVFLSMVVLQLLGLLFSFNGTGLMSTGTDEITLSIHYYTADIVIVLTMLWGMSTAALLTTRAYRYDDFSFITNRLSSHLSNMCFLTTISVVGGITSMLSGYLLKIIKYYSLDEIYVGGSHLSGAPMISEFMMGTSAAVFYIILLSALGYFLGMLFQFSKALTTGLAIVIIAVYITSINNGDAGLIGEIFSSYFEEPSFFFFFIKIFVTAAILFAGAAAVSNRMEVRT